MSELTGISFFGRSARNTAEAVTSMRRIFDLSKALAELANRVPLKVIELFQKFNEEMKIADKASEKVVAKIKEGDMIAVLGAIKELTSQLVNKPTLLGRLEDEVLKLRSRSIPPGDSSSPIA